MGEKPEVSQKDFGLIAADYAFFMQSATEAEADMESHLAEIRLRFGDTRPICLLDVGCGEGQFLSELLQRLRIPAKQLSLQLVEPVTEHLATARQRLREFSTDSIRDWSGMEQVPTGSCDIILLNHSGYYVEDPGQLIEQVVAATRSRGMCIFALADGQNALIKLWKMGFGSAGLPVPYWTADDYRAILKERRLDFIEKTVPYEIRFPDVSENRLRLLRFLFADHLEKLDTEFLLSAFDSDRRDGQVLIPTVSTHFIVRN